VQDHRQRRRHGRGVLRRRRRRRALPHRGLLLDTAGYKIDAGRRETPGEVEYHEHTVDVMHVLEGSATVVLGGEMRGVRKVAHGELRAAAIEGGERRELEPGDVLAIPSGLPHQFVDVSNPFLYFVAKVAS
jgi:mannose-6-phosphate isomerase-like protein (cupin superfamily)